METSSNSWRWGAYPAPPGVRTVPLDGAELTRSLRDAAQTRSRQRQAELRRTTGFAGELAERAHAIERELRKLGYTHSTAAWGAHAASAGLQWNWQGQRALSSWMDRSERTARRARAELEADGLLRSHLLLPGQQVLGQRAPVKRPQIVRDVSPLHGLVGDVAAPTRRAKEALAGRAREPNPPPRPSSSRIYNAAVVPERAPPTEMTADDFDELALRSPELSVHYRAMAAAKRGVKRDDTKPAPPPNAVRYIDPKDIDEWDAWTRHLDHQFAIKERERLEREELERIERPPDKRSN